MALINGTSEHDVLNGGADDDQIFGFEGNDGLQGGGGNDSLEGGADNDGLSGDFGNDTVLGGDGHDSLDGGAGDDHLIGGNGDDYFRDNLAGVNFLDGGAGNDRFEVAVLGNGNVVSSTVTGGTGQDTYALGGVSFGSTLDFVVTDFGVETEKDLIDLDGLLGSYAIGYTGGNPFGLGYVQLVASGSDTLLQWDFDGPDDGVGSEEGWITQLILKDVAPGQITATNFIGGIPPDGSTVPGEAISGGIGNDTLVGGFFNDTVSGGAGRDRLQGKGGDDVLDGGGSNDILLGSFGNDVLRGGSGNDSFDLFHSGHQGFSDADTTFGDDYLLGGPGNDVLVDYRGSNTLEGNDGDDLFLLVGGSGGNATTMVGGTGQDTYRLDGTAFGIFGGNTDYVVEDFGVGAETDLLDIMKPVTFVAAGGIFTGGNPFDPGLGFARLIQSGADTLLQFDHDGAEGADFGWATQVTLKNVLPVQFSAANFVDGIRPDGSASGPGLSLSGSSASDTLTGGFDHDAISGLDGHDRLDGGLGNDTVNGGLGHDGLRGGFGNDKLIGGAGNDVFGLHTHEDGYGDDHLIGGTGDDYFEDVSGVNIIEGGSGNDTIVAASTGAPESSSTVTGGSGRDTYLLGGLAYLLETPDSGYTAVDFAVGAGGDLLHVDALLFESGSNGGYTGGDPFALGYLRLEQSGADTLVQWDRDAAGTEWDWTTQLRLKDVISSSVTADNFAGRLIAGTAGNDVLVGGFGNDTVRGFGGNDTLDGSLGGDLLEGGSGNDLYFVDDAGDEIFEASNSSTGALVLPGTGAGQAGAKGVTDTVVAAIDYALGNFVENLTLSGSASRATGNDLANRITGNAGANTLNGGGGNDTLNGGAGADRANGGAGDDVMVWGAGDKRLDGSTGTDTLKVTSGMLDLTGVGQTVIVNVEKVDLRGKATGLVLTAQDVLDMSATDSLTVLGDAGDKVDTSGFTAQGAAVGGFRTYKNGLATLVLDIDIAVV